MDKTLVIEIPYAGLGDHLFHSHIPRIAKETGMYNKVYISEFSPFRSLDDKRIVWKLNPYIDGFIAEHGKSINITSIVNKIENSTKRNLLDEVMLGFDLDNGIRNHQPEIYYNPTYNPEFDLTIFDPNFLSWTGSVTKEDFMTFFQKKTITIDAVMKKRSEKYLYVPHEKTKILETPTLEEFLDLIYSAKQLYCVCTGTAHLAAALKKPATILYGKDHPKAYFYSDVSEYIQVPNYFTNKIRRQFNRQ